MKIAIHHREGSFSDNWINYCKLNNIEFKIVNAFNNSIIKEISDYDLFLWNFHHTHNSDLIQARSLLFTLEKKGVKVYPDIATSWHFDDKISQKTIFEAFNIPSIKSYVFYDKIDALNWLKTTEMPKIFKLKSGSGGLNVRKINSKNKAKSLIKRAFGLGFKSFSIVEYAKDQYKKTNFNFSKIIKVTLKIIYLYTVGTEFTKNTTKQKGYIYFQDFIPENNFDVRLIVIDNKAYGMKRLVRHNDFRASGSNSFIYDEIDLRILKIGFEVADLLNLQSVAFDFIYKNNKPVIIEMSYTFGTKGSSKCNGYYDKNYNFNETKFQPIDWIIESLLKK
jgi:glutathione synthase/RimK-type ligase-like ATP-grasp enzyme